MLFPECLLWMHIMLNAIKYLPLQKNKSWSCMCKLMETAIITFNVLPWHGNDVSLVILFSII